VNKLNLGSGKDYREGWVNADAFHSKADVKMDFNKKFPFKDNAFDKILMIHSLEHSKDVTFTIEECIRVLKNGGVLKIIVPHSSKHSAMTCLDHWQEFDSGSFSYFYPEMVCNYMTKGNLELERVWFTNVNAWKLSGLAGLLANKYPKWWERWASKLFEIHEIEYILKVVK